MSQNGSNLVSPDKPLVALATFEIEFANRMKQAALRAGADFYSSLNLDHTVDECVQRPNACVVIDFEVTKRDIPPLTILPMATKHSMLVAIPHGDVNAAFQAATIGAVSVFEKEESVDQLANCLDIALQSGKQFDKSASGASSTLLHHEAFGTLTSRERSILFHLINGQPNKCVASLLDIGLRTVESDRAKIMKKLSVNSFAELVRFVSSIEDQTIRARQTAYEMIARSGRNLGS